MSTKPKEWELLRLRTTTQSNTGESFDFKENHWFVNELDSGKCNRLMEARFIRKKELRTNMYNGYLNQDIVGDMEKQGQNILDLYYTFLLLIYF